MEPLQGTLHLLTPPPPNLGLFGDDDDHFSASEDDLNFYTHAADDLFAIKATVGIPLHHYQNVDLYPSPPTHDDMEEIMALVNPMPIRPMMSHGHSRPPAFVLPQVPLPHDFDEQLFQYRQPLMRISPQEVEQKRLIMVAKKSPATGMTPGFSRLQKALTDPLPSQQQQQPMNSVQSQQQQRPQQQPVKCTKCGQELSSRCLMQTCAPPPPVEIAASETTCVRCGLELTTKCILSMCTAKP